ncbi:MAG: hypothetical protein M3041_04175 [Acidobacteriota bacterium]|nr:hypothetical protein [Acidobacteriota bacterium]
MRSKIAEKLRREQMEHVLALSISERVALAFSLGERDLQVYIAFQKVDRETAIDAIRREHQLGRRDSRCMNESLQ